MIDVIGLGSTFVDYFFKADENFLKKYKLKPEDDFLFEERKIDPREILKELQLVTKSIGGMSTNTIKILSILGISAGYYGVIGKNDEGNFWLKNINRINVSKIIQKGKMSICYCILTDGGRKRLFLSKMNPRDTEFLKNIDYNFLNKTKYIHITPFFTQNLSKIFIELEKIVKNLSLPIISFTPGTTYINLGFKKILPVIKKTDILFLNSNEMRLLTGRNEKAGSNFLLKYKPKIVVCTMGEKGALITSKNDQFYIKAKKIKKVIDTTGAGDAFAAGFLYGLIKNKSLKWSANFANKIASQSVTDYGLNWLDGLKDKTV